MLLGYVAEEEMIPALKEFTLSEKDRLKDCHCDANWRMLWEDRQLWDQKEPFADILEESGSEPREVREYVRRAFQADTVPLSEGHGLKEPGACGEYGMCRV